MRPVHTFAAALLIASAVSMGLAQAQKVSTVEDYDKVMKMIGPAFGAVNKAIQSNAYTDAKTQLATARQGLMAVQAFWEANKRADAAGMAKDALTKIEALDKTLSASMVDQTAALAGFKEVAGACGACHKMYRDQDPTTKLFTMKPDVAATIMPR